MLPSDSKGSNANGFSVGLVGEDWLHSSYISRSDILRFESMGIEISLDEIYEELDLPEPLLAIELPKPDSQVGE